MKNYREVAETVLKRRDAYKRTQKRKRDAILRVTAGGGTLCLMALLGFGIYRSGSGYPDRVGTPRSNPDPDVYYVLSESNSSEADGSDAFPVTDSTADGSDSFTASAGSIDSDRLSPADSAGGNGSMASAESTSSSSLPDGDALHPATSQEPASEGNDMLSVSYSSLSLPQGQVMPEIISEYAASSQSEAEILPFSEDLLSKSSAILEGRITDMYLKRYAYDTYDDKFGPKEIYHNQSSSVVYELTVDKVWYGDESLSGTSVLIEDDIYPIDSYFSLKVGRSYVIPVCDLDEEKWIWGEYAGGDLKRDGSYTTLYPHHPQIEVTTDGDYIVTTDWETLCPDDAKTIQLDIPENSLVEYHPENKAGEDGLITTEWRTLLVSAYDMVYYYDKLKLVGADEFFIQLNRLTDQLP